MADNNPETYLATDDPVIISTITVDFDAPKEFNRFLVQEDIRFGQRAKEFTLEAFQSMNGSKLMPRLLSEESGSCVFQM